MTMPVISKLGFILKYLTKEGFDVDTAFDGNEAIHKAKKVKYDVILMDIFMPRKNGIEAIRNIMKHDNSNKIIATTGTIGWENEYLTMSEDLGAIDSLQKPFELEELVIHLKKITKDSV